MAYRRFSHPEIEIEHNNFKANIHKDGKVTISNHDSSEESEYDEITIPASLIFKLANVLKNTRKVEYIENLTDLVKE